MRIYISGKMRGLPEDESRRLFRAAEQYLTGLGHDIVNPWNSELEKDASCSEWADYIMFDLNILKTCDAIYMLDNWEDSWGAKCEHAFASGMGMEIFYETIPALSDKINLNRACDWLTLNINMLLRVFDVEYNTNETDVGDFIENFRKAMKE